jgi:hypothetical protein
VRKWWWAVGLVVVLVPLCCCGGGWVVVLPMFFSKAAVEKAHAKCVELGYPADRLVFANYNWSGDVVGQSDVSVSFIVAGSRPTKWVHVNLQRPFCLADWAVTSWEEQEVPDERLNGRKADDPLDNGR